MRNSEYSHNALTATYTQTDSTGDSVEPRRSVMYAIVCNVGQKVGPHMTSIHWSRASASPPDWLSELGRLVLDECRAHVFHSSVQFVRCERAFHLQALHSRTHARTDGQVAATVSLARHEYASTTRINYSRGR